MQKLYSYKVMILLWLIFIVSCSGKDDIIRKEVTFHNSVSMEGSRTIDWKLYPLYINGKLYVPKKNRFREEMLRIIDQRSIESLASYLKRNNLRINTGKKSCSSVQSFVENFFDGYFQYMRKEDLRNAGYFIHSVSWIEKNWGKLVARSEQGGCIGSGLDFTTYVYVLLYLEAKQMGAESDGPPRMY